jgi:hypothetical protein
MSLIWINQTVAPGLQATNGYDGIADIVKRQDDTLKHRSNHCAEDPRRRSDGFLETRIGLCKGQRNMGIDRLCTTFGHAYLVAFFVRAVPDRQCHHHHQRSSPPSGALCSHEAILRIIDGEDSCASIDGVIEVSTVGYGSI